MLLWPPRSVRRSKERGSVFAFSALSSQSDPSESSDFSHYFSRLCDSVEAFHSPVDVDCARAEPVSGVRNESAMAKTASVRRRVAFVMAAFLRGCRISLPCKEETPPRADSWRKIFRENFRARMTPAGRKSRAVLLHSAE